MEMDRAQGGLGDDSPVSHNEEDMSDGDPHSGAEQEDSCDEIRRHGILTDHNDVLTKLKMQVRDINVRVSNGLFPLTNKDDYENQRNQLNFPRPQEGGIPFPVPFPFQHPATAFLPPMAPQPQPPSSGSSHSSEGSASSQHTWSFEEQFKQLYEINDDPKRKEFLDDLFSFMQKRGTPINRLPIMAKSVLDLYELYNLVIARGGLVDVINKKLWQEIIKGLHLPSSITSAAFTLRTQYMKYLYPYECDKRQLSTPAELQAAIDGNRREGRRSSYGQYDGMARYGYESPNPTHQLNPLSLVSAAQQQQLAARMNSVMAGGVALHNGVHHPSHPPPMNQPMNGGGPLPGLPNLAPSEFEARMMEYIKLLNKTDMSSLYSRPTTTTPPRQGDVTPPNATSPLTPFEVQQRMNLFNLYNNNQPQVEPQKEPINLSEPTTAIKREPECRESPPPPKRITKEEEEEPKMNSPASPVHRSTHIKINNRGDARNGDNSLVVSMELNGVTYQGVLFAQTSSQSNSHAAIAS
ncbi:AT-rich interactive domain-containing protein 3C-like isoform X3 [Anthonomus grandis grandis]|uniref:AT-rich interactive domain-containing protein 3C-like isoform X3 n=1 Tax=Anthonomus grandis grandis TaxID=2921223 RepID=UPI002166384E|nr:AT-rich interactive domain-containing protein 3C-like isoform X3 [Anthonomus grandis grandis]